MRPAVLVLAGTRSGPADPMARAAGVSHKALIPVLGTPMIVRVIEALRATPGLGPIAISIENPAVLDGIDQTGLTILPTGNGPAASVGIALERLGTPLLVTTADNALLRPQWVTDFLRRMQPGCDLAAAIAMRSTIERDVPGTQRTWLPFTDGAFSGCNLFLFRTERARAVATLWQTLEHERKRPWRMARLLGPGILLRYVLRRMSRPALYRRIKALTGAQARLVSLPDGRACVDVDKPADLILTEALLRQDAARAAADAAQDTPAQNA